MNDQFESKIADLIVAKLRNSPAITCVSRLDLVHFDSQPDSPRLVQRLPYLSHLRSLESVTVTPVINRLSLVLGDESNTEVSGHDARLERIQASVLAERLGINFVEALDTVESKYVLELQQGQLSLRAKEEKSKDRFSLNFEKTRKLDSHHPLIRVMGNDVKHVIDATAGWCTDAAALCRYGYRVSAMEKSPIVSTMVELAISDMAWSNRFSLQCCDSVEALREQEIRGCVVYLDPMYPTTSKSAKSKKGLQWLQRLVGPPQRESDLLFTALGSAEKRVVVKRPHFAAPVSLDEMQLSLIKNEKLSGGNLVGCIRTKLVRFDIYRPFTTN